MRIIETETLDSVADNLSDDDIYWVYNGLDCCLTHEIKTKLAGYLDEVSGATYAHTMEMQAPILEMMLNGLLLDLTKRQEIISHYEAQLDKLEAIWQRMLVDGLGLPADGAKRKGKPPLALLWSSPKQLQVLFHDILKLPAKRKRAKGADHATITLGREVLEELKIHYFAEPFVNLILAMRDASKAVGFMKTKFDEDNRVRCSFNLAGTNTGRLSSSFSDMGTGTNLQNVSGKLKDVFVARKGYYLIDIDLEQADSRNVGALAWNLFYESHGEKFAGSYLDACESGDLHTTVCEMAWTEFDWTNPKFTKKQIAEQIAYRDLSYRDMSKKLGHGSNYMGQPKTMAGHTKVPVRTIETFQQNYFLAFPCIPGWQQWTINEVRSVHCLTHLFGRRRYFWGDANSQSVINQAIAYSPQGMTGEEINRGILQLWKLRNQTELPIYFLLQVHDSLVIEVEESRKDELIPVILEALKVILVLKGGREFYVPHGIKGGWNYGRFDEGKNPHGLRAYKGSDDRKPPIRFGGSLESLLDMPLIDLIGKR